VKEVVEAVTVVLVMTILLAAMMKVPAKTFVMAVVKIAMGTPLKKVATKKIVLENNDLLMLFQKYQ
jgi:hypothetical protein